MTFISSYIVTPWMRLQEQLRRTPGLVSVSLVNDDFTSNWNRLVMDLDGEVFFNWRFDIARMVDDPELVGRVVNDQIAKLINAQYEDVDWSDYFFSEEPKRPFWAAMDVDRWREINGS